MSDSLKPPGRAGVPIALLIGNGPHSRKKAVVRSIRAGGKVLKVPCPDGSVKLIGIAPDGRWVAEWSCLESDFVETMIDRMVLHVRHSKAVGLPRIALI